LPASGPPHTSWSPLAVPPFCVLNACCRQLCWKVGSLVVSVYLQRLDGIYSVNR
jgi:hypothetical protein